MRVHITPLHSFFLLVCTTLLTVLVYELSAPLSALEPPLIRLHRGDAKPTQVKIFMPLPPASFSVINDRPVFNPLRTPIKPAASPDEAAAAAPPPPPKFALVGIILDGQSKLALIKMPGAPFATGVAIGGDVAGWQVSQIDSNGIVLHSGSSDYRVPLDGSSGAAAPAASDGPQQK